MNHVPTNVSLEDRLQVLWDRAEIADLVHHLLGCLDDRNFDKLTNIFTGDASANTPGGNPRGLDAIIAQVSAGPAPHLATQHLAGNLQIEAEGDHADISAHVVATFTPRLVDGRGPAPSPVFSTGLAYRFTAKRIRDRWRLTRVDIAPQWVLGSVLPTTDEGGGA